MISGGDALNFHAAYRSCNETENMAHKPFSFSSSHSTDEPGHVQSCKHIPQSCKRRQLTRDVPLVQCVHSGWSMMLKCGLVRLECHAGEMQWHDFAEAPVLIPSVEPAKCWKENKSHHNQAHYNPVDTTGHVSTTHSHVTRCPQTLELLAGRDCHNLVLKPDN